MKSLSRVLLFSISISLLWISPVPGSDLTHKSKTEPVTRETTPTTQQSGKTVHTPKTAPGFCCIKGTIVSSDERTCRARKGKYSRNKQEIQKICRAPAATTRGTPVTPGTAPVSGYCCSDGTVLSTNSLACEKRKGSFFTSRREADRKCGETAGYCCKSGEYKESTKRDCEKVRGVFTRDRQKGFAACQATIGFCCIRGKVMQLSRGQCDQKKGSFSSFREKAEKVCLSTPGFCCTNGKVLSVHRQECDRKSGTFHGDRATALRSCQPQLSNPKGKLGTPPSTSLTRQGSQAAGVSAQAAVFSLKPDLMVLKTSLGKDCKLRVTVKNQGGSIGEAEHSGAEVYISAGQGNALSPRKRYLRVLDPDKKLKTAGAEVTYVSDLLVSGTQSTLVWLDTAHHIAESNEQNNGDDQELICTTALPYPKIQTVQPAVVVDPPPPQPGPGQLNNPCLVDLAVTDIAIDPEQPRIVSDTMHIEVTVSNVGVCSQLPDAPDAYFELFLTDYPYTQYTRTIIQPYSLILPHLDGNEEHTITESTYFPSTYGYSNGQTITLQPGTYEITAIINTTNYQPNEEYNPSNNTLKRQFTLRDPPPSDLMIQNLSLTPDCRLKVQITNRGAEIPLQDFNQPSVVIRASKDGWYNENVVLSVADPGGNVRPAGGTTMYEWPPSQNQNPAHTMGLGTGQVATFQVDIDPYQMVSDSAPYNHYDPSQSNNYMEKTLTCY